MKNTEDAPKLNQIYEICLQRIMKVNQTHRKNNSMQFIYRLMCHQPLTIAKWIWCKGSGINMKTLRSFVSYMSTEDLFDAEAVIKTTMDSLQIISFKYTNNIFFSQILKFKDHLISLQNTQNHDNQEKEVGNHENKALMLIKQSIRLLNKKRNDIQTKQIELLRQKNHIDYALYIKDPKMYMQKQLSQYVFSDKDDAYEDLKDQISIKSKWRSKVESSQNKHSDKIGKIYQEIPLPTAHRPRKNSEYFPQMLDVFANFMEDKMLKNSSSQKNLPKNLSQQHHPKNNDRIPEQQAQQLSSLIQIKIDQSKGGQSPKILRRISKSNSLSFEDSQMQNFNFEFKISIKQQKFVQPGQMVIDLLSTIYGDSGVFDLSKLRIQARREQFRKYLQEVLDNLYHIKNHSYTKCINLFNSIVQEYVQSYSLNRKAIAIFQKLFQYKAISHVNFNFKEALPVSMLFNNNLQEFYERFQELFMVGINSIEVFPRLKFVNEVVGKQWKQKLMVALVLQKIRHIKQMRSKIGQKIQKEQQSKIIKELEMQQLKIGVLIDEDINVINRLTKLSKQFQNDEDKDKKEMGLILKLSVSAIIENF